MVQINNWLVDTVFAKILEVPTLDTLMVVVETSKPLVDVIRMRLLEIGTSYC